MSWLIRSIHLSIKWYPISVDCAEEATLRCDIFMASGSLAFSTDLLIKVRWGVRGDWPFSSICFLAASSLGVYFPLFPVSNRARREGCTLGYPAVWIIQSLGLAVCTCTVQTHTHIFIAQQQNYASVSVLVSKQCTHSRCAPVLTQLHLKAQQHLAVVAATQMRDCMHTYSNTQVHWL